MLVADNPRSRSARLVRRLFSGCAPGQLVIQYTDRCNAQCPQCGMRASNQFQRHSLDETRVETIISAAAERGFAALSFTGGEPFLHLDEICRLSRFAEQQGIRYVRTGTNGYLFCGSQQPDYADRIKRLADQLAGTPIRNLWVSIDSSDPQTHEQLRGLPGVIKGIEQALPIFAERGLYLSANLGINRKLAGPRSERKLGYDFFYDGFDRFYRFVAELGFSIANVCYPMWSDAGPQQSAAVYAATASDRIVYFSNQEKRAMFQALFDVIPNHRHKLRIFTPRSSLHALLNQYRGKPQLSSPCRGGRDFFFIDSRHGHCYPCGYRGEENLGDFERLDLSACSTEECRRCDWECFRDPSELFAPLLDLRRSPLKLFRRLSADADFYRLWWNDLRYYRRCAYFDGRQPAQLFSSSSLPGD